jgi:hypothetical protein
MSLIWIRRLTTFNLLFEEITLSAHKINTCYNVHFVKLQLASCPIPSIPCWRIGKQIELFFWGFRYSCDICLWAEKLTEYLLKNLL